MTTRELLLSAWDPGRAVPVLCVAALAVYAARLRGRFTPRALYFFTAVGLVFLALASPLGVLARGYLFSAHMAQHLLLLLAVPPLALLGLPRETNSQAPRAGGVVRHVAPWVAGVGAMWLWHAPTLCNAASRSGGLQGFQTASLLALGLWFWWPILAPSRHDRFAPFAAILYLFGACLACTVLGILVTFSPVEVCSVYLHPVDRLGVLGLLRAGWGLSPSVDQQLGGLMMWVPACFVYAGAILATLARYYREEGRAPLPASGHHAPLEAR